MRYHARSFYHREDGAASVEAVVLMAVMAAMAALIALSVFEVVGTFAESLTLNTLTAARPEATETSP